MSPSIAAPPAPPTGPSGASGSTAPSGTATLDTVPSRLVQAFATGGPLQAIVTSTAEQAGAPTTANRTITLSILVPTENGAKPVSVPLQIQTPLPLLTGATLTVSLQTAGPPPLLTLTPHSGGAPVQPPVSQSGMNPTGTTPPASVTSLSQGSVFAATITGNSALTGAGGPSALSALPPGTTLQLQLLNWAPQGHSLPEGSSGFLATVTGHTPLATTVRTAAGTLSISLPNPPATGTQLLFSLVGEPILPTGPDGFLNATRFDILHEAISLLRSADPAAARHLTQGLLPQTNGQLGLAAALLIGALRHGAVERWLGRDVTRAIEGAGSKSDLLGRLTSALSQPQGRAHDSAGQEWRLTHFPILNDGDIDQIRLYTKQPEEDRSGDGDPDDRGRRFVIEANFSRLGPIQLDGFSIRKQLDMVVRSQTALPEDARDDIRRLFADTISALGYSGTAGFQVVPVFDLVPEPVGGTAREGFVV